jgi:hypothetical protein
MKLAIGFMILCGLYGFVLTCWHLKLMVYLHREHTPEWQKLGPLIFGNQLWPYSIRYPVWSWRSLGFFLFKRYKILNDPEFVCRAFVSLCAHYLALDVGDTDNRRTLLESLLAKKETKGRQKATGDAIIFATNHLSSLNATVASGGK